MKRSAAIITATLAALAFSSCSTIRQYHLAPEDDGSTPTTTIYVIDIGTPEFPVDTGIAPVAAVVECDGGSTNPCPTVTPEPPDPCQDFQAGACLPEGSCTGVADCGPQSTEQPGPVDLSDCSPEALKVGACDSGTDASG